MSLPSPPDASQRNLKPPPGQDSADVVVRELETADMPAAAALLEEVWRGGPTPMETSLLVTLRHIGHYCAGAYLDQELVGVCVGLLAVPAGEVLHSHVTGVAPGFAGRGVGRALKLHQRDWCERHGLATITWTYDPLVARNAWFNLARLGARPRDYVVDFYGDLDDGLNVGQGSDRLLVAWPVAPEPAAGCLSIPVAEVYPVLRVASGDQPVLESVPAGHELISLAVPHDIEALRLADPALGLAWRRAFRSAYELVTEAGWAVTTFDRSAGYLLEKAGGTR